MSDVRIVIKVTGVESLSPVVSLLAAAGAKRIGRSRSFAVDGMTVTPTQAGAISGLAAEEGVQVVPPEIPQWWTIGDGPCEEIPDMDEQDAEAWWLASYDNPARPI